MNTPEDKFSSLMLNSKLEMPFSDFEEVTMKKIQADLKYKSYMKYNFLLSVSFFVLGTAFGLVVNNILSSLSGTILGISSGKALIWFQLIFVLIVLSQSENIYKLFTKLRESSRP